MPAANRALDKNRKIGTAAYLWQPGRRRNRDNDCTVLKGGGTGASVRALAVGRAKKAAKRSVMEKK